MADELTQDPMQEQISPLQEEETEEMTQEPAPEPVEAPFAGPGSPELQLQTASTEAAVTDQAQAARNRREQLTRDVVARRRRAQEGTMLGGINSEVADVTDEDLIEEAKLQQEEIQVAEQREADQQKVEAERQRRITEGLNQFGIAPSEDSPQGEISLEQQATEEQVAAAQAEEDANKEIAAQNAIDKAVVKKEMDDEQKKKDVDKKLKDQDEEVAKIPKKDFWSKQSTGSKIGMVIAAAFMGAAGMGDKALQMIDQMAEDDLKNQKLKYEDFLAKKEEALNEPLRKIEFQIKNATVEEKRQRAKLLQQQMLEKQNEIRSKRVQLQLMQSGEGVIPELLGEKDRERLVAMPNGTAQLAFNKDSANKLRETKNELEPVVDGLRRVMSLSRNGSRFNLRDRAKINSEIKAVLGQLRIPFTGPGVLTDSERELLEKTIGNPNSFLALPSIERQKLKTVTNKIINDLNVNYKNAGVRAPDYSTLRESYIQKIIKPRYPKKSEQDYEDIVDSLIRKGKLGEEYI